MARRLDRDRIRASLAPSAVLAHFRVAHTGGEELRVADCPGCGPRLREVVAIQAGSGVWYCHRCGEHGDVFDLVAAYAELDVEDEFTSVLALAQKIAGSTINSLVTRRQSRVAAPAISAERARATATVPVRWASLPRRSALGEGYLRSRCVDPATLVERDLVRFDRQGNVVVALHDLADGRPVNLVTRRRDPGQPKVFGLKGCTTLGTLVGNVSEIGHARTSAVLTEGVFDSLAAALIWPEHVVLGAHGASRLAQIATSIAPRLRAAKGSLLTVPHADGGVGEAAMTRAIRAAVAIGLVLDIDVSLIDVLPHKDLAEALNSGGWSVKC